MKINGFLSKLNKLVKEVTNNLENFELGIATTKSI